MDKFSIEELREELENREKEQRETNCIMDIKEDDKESQAFDCKVFEGTCYFCGTYFYNYIDGISGTEEQKGIYISNMNGIEFFYSVNVQTSGSLGKSSLSISISFPT